jgi:two-component system chemotaxis response regulator CheY
MNQNNHFKRNVSNLVLIAEDEDLNRALLSKIVKDEGMSVVLASSGRRAWEIIQDNPDLSLLITDMRMPEMNGEELINRIKATDKISHLPVIMVSGIVRLSEISHILESGAHRFLPKPINVEHLKQYIREVKSTK